MSDQSLNDQSARDNWQRYTYGKERGHLEYMAQAKKCEGMYLGAGEQWSKEDRDVLDEQKRPAYEFNEIMPSVNSAIGYQIHNRADIAFKPRGEDGDLATATVLSKVVMQVCDANQFHWRETQVFSDGLIEQRGYFDARITYDTNIKGEIQITTLDPRDVIPDPDAKSYDPATWSDVIVTRWLTLDEIEGLYGRKARDFAEASGDESEDFGDADDETERNKFGQVTQWGRYSRADAYGSNVDGLKRYRVIDRQFRVYENTECLVFAQSGDVAIASSMTPEQQAQALADGAVKARRMKSRIKWVVSTYSTTLFDDYSPYDDFTIVPYFAYFRRGKTRGLVDNGIGPQEALNKAVSQYVHIINTSANSGWLIEENSLTNIDTEELEAVGAMTGLVLEYKKGSERPSKIQPNAVPTGVDRLIDRATTALKDVTVPEAMRGGNGPELSGVAIQSRQFASQQQLAVPLDNLAYTRQLLAKRVLKLIQTYYDSYRVFRITETDPMTGKELQNTLEINKPDGMGGYLNDVTIGTYDVVVSEQPMQVTFENSQFTQALEMRKNGIGIPDATVIRYSNLADKHEILRNMHQSSADPLEQAKAELTQAQARKADAEATATSVGALYSAMQSAQVITANPLTAPLADKLARSAGFVDRDQAPIIPQPAESMAAIPIDPIRTPLVGMQDGIETARPDGVEPAIGQ